MNDQDVRSALIAGGIPAEDLDGDPSNHVAAYSSLLDPPGAEALGRCLSDALHSCQPTRVVVWEDIENSVLAHIVARELGVTALRIIDASGVLDYDGSFGDDDRVVIVADAFRSDFPINAMRALIENHGGRVVAFGALLNTPALVDAAGSIPVTTLWGTPRPGGGSASS
jgi:hypothetical protein